MIWVLSRGVTTSQEFGWSSVGTIAKGDKALKGSALLCDLESSSRDRFTNPYRPKVDTRSNDLKCYTCGKSGHTKTQCNREDFSNNVVDTNKPETSDQRTGSLLKSFVFIAKNPVIWTPIVDSNLKTTIVRTILSLKKR